MICRNCGTELEPGDRFCIKCGAPIDEQTANPQPKAEAREDKAAKKARVTALATAAQNGDENAFAELYETFYQKVFALAKTTVKTDADAEDVLQLTFIKAWKNIGGLKNPEAFSTWIQRITLNQCYTLLRSRHVDVSIDESEDDESFGPIRLETDLMLPEVYAERADLRARLSRIIDGLSSVQKQTIMLYYYDGLPVENIAWVMDCSVNTVKSRLFLARKSIKTEIEEQERKSGQPFFGIIGLATVPFGKLFIEHVESSLLDAGTASGIFESITARLARQSAKTAQTGSAEAAERAANTAAKAASNVGAKAAAATGAKAAAKVGASIVSKKVIIGVIAGVLVTGAAAGGTAAAVHASREKQRAVETIDTLPSASPFPGEGSDHSEEPSDMTEATPLPETQEPGTEQPTETPEPTAEPTEEPAAQTSEHSAEEQKSDWRLVRETFYSYSEFGSGTSQTIYQYRDDGSLSDVTLYNKSDNSISQLTEYDRNGNITMDTYYRYGSPNYYLIYTYDTNGNCVRCTSQRLGDNGWSEDYIDYTYDANGNMLREKHYSENWDGNETVYAYDANNRLIREGAPGGYQTAYEYDANGRCVRMSEESYYGLYATEYTYDANGRLMAERYGKVLTASGEPVAPSEMYLRAEYKYDANGRLTEKTEYNSDGSISERTVTQYDDHGRELLTTVQWGPFIDSPYYEQAAKREYDAYGNCITLLEYYNCYGLNDDPERRTDYVWERIGDKTAEAPASAQAYAPRYRTIATAYGSPVHAIRNDGSLLSSEWFPDSMTNLVSIAVSEPDDDYLFLALRSDGTVETASYALDLIDGISGWRDIVEIAADSGLVLGRKSDGTVVSWERGTYNSYEPEKIAEWTDIIAIAAGGRHSVGLKADGTVVACGRNSSGECEVSGWTDIVAIDAGFDYTIGLKADGTVVFCGDDEAFISSVEEWTDITAIAAGRFCVLGLKKDGTVVSTDLGEYDVSGWTDVVAIAAGTYAIGLKADGTVVVTPVGIYNKDVSEWSDIRVP